MLGELRAIRLGHRDVQTIDHRLRDLGLDGHHLSRGASVLIPPDERLRPGVDQFDTDGEAAGFLPDTAGEQAIDAQLGADSA